MIGYVTLLIAHRNARFDCFLNSGILLFVITSAVKRLKYLIAINRIYVIVNSKLIAITRKFLSILNVPSFIYFFPSFYFYFNALINMEKWIGLLYANILFY